MRTVTVQDFEVGDVLKRDIVGLLHNGPKLGLYVVCKAVEHPLKRNGIQMLDIRNVNTGVKTTISSEWMDGLHFRYLYNWNT